MPLLCPLHTCRCSLKIYIQIKSINALFAGIVDNQLTLTLNKPTPIFIITQLIYLSRCRFIAVTSNKAFRLTINRLTVAG
jgi:hypothetical protein